MHCYRIVDKLQGREGEGLMGLGWGFAKHELVFFEVEIRPWSAWDGPGWLWLWSSGAVLWRLQSSVLAYLIYSKLVRIWGSRTSSSHLWHHFASLFCCYDFCTSELQSLVFYFLGRGVECLEFVMEVETPKMILEWGEIMSFVLLLLHGKWTLWSVFLVLSYKNCLDVFCWGLYPIWRIGW